MRKTKIVATLGPASSSPEMIGQLMDAGVSVIRLNFSHGAHGAHAENIARIRELAHARDRMVPIMADLQGPKIRVGQLEGDQQVEIEKGGTLRLMSGLIELVPGLFLLPFEADLDPIYAPAEKSDALIWEEFRFLNVKLGVDYTD